MDLIKKASTTLAVISVVDKAFKGKAKEKDFKNTSSLGKLNTNLESINDTVKLVGKFKKFIK